MREYIVCCDIGRKRDAYTEVAIRDIPHIERGVKALGTPDRTVHTYSIVWLKRLRGAAYSAMVDSTVRLVNHADLVNNHDLLVDATGVGDAVVELLRVANANPIPIVFTSGDQAKYVYLPGVRLFAEHAEQLAPMRTLEQINVPKSDLVAAGQMLLEQRRITLASDLPEVERAVFAEQLRGFTEVETKQAGRKPTFEAETERLHDDYVTAYLMGAWWAHQQRSAVPEAAVRRHHDPSLDWDPMEMIVHGHT